MGSLANVSSGYLTIAEIQRYRAAFRRIRKASVVVAIRTAITALMVKKTPIKLGDPFTLKLV